MGAGKAAGSLDSRCKKHRVGGLAPNKVRKLWQEVGIGMEPIDEEVRKVFREELLELALPWVAQ